MRRDRQLDFIPLSHVKQGRISNLVLLSQPGHWTPLRKTDLYFVLPPSPPFNPALLQTSPPISWPWREHVACDAVLVKLSGHSVSYFSVFRYFPLSGKHDGCIPLRGQWMPWSVGHSPSLCVLACFNADNKDVSLSGGTYHRFVVITLVCSRSNFQAQRLWNVVLRVKRGDYF